MKQQPELKCHIVPTEQGNMLIPDDLLIDVINLDQLPVNHQVIWRGRKVPLCIASSDIDEVSVPSRVAIIKTIMEDRTLPFFAIKVVGIPHSIYVSEEMMSDEETGKQIIAVAARLVRVGNLSCMIPDIPKIERYIQHRIQHY